jgi:tRNA modification GTPase
LRLHVEAAIDFPEEEIDFLADGKILALLEDVQQSVHAVQPLRVKGSCYVKVYRL